MQIRLLCCSDTHGKPPPSIDAQNAAAWLHAGDITNGPTAVADGSDPLADPLRAETALWFTRQSIPILAVRGNHDTLDDLNAFHYARDISGSVVKIVKGLFVVGIGWCGDRYFELPSEHDLVDVCDAVRRRTHSLIKPGDRVVMLTHYPPRLPGMRDVGINVDGGGIWFDCIREFAKELRAVAVVQGHIHQWFKSAQTWRYTDGQMLVISPGPSGAAVSIDLTTSAVTHEWLQSQPPAG